jgi:hypothetical protein
LQLSDSELLVAKNKIKSLLEQNEASAVELEATANERDKLNQDFFNLRNLLSAPPWER